MMYKIIVLFLGVLSSVISFGQTSYGLKAGINLSDQYQKTNPPGYPADRLETKLLPGIQMGAFLKHAFNSKVNIAVELNYSSVGSKTLYTRTDFIVDPNGNIQGPTHGYYTNRMQLVEMPVLVQYNISKFYFGLGPALGIKIAARDKAFDNNFYNNPYYHALDFGAVAMAGYSVSKTIGFNVKYSYGLTDADKRAYYKVNNRVLTCSVLYNVK